MGVRALGQRALCLARRGSVDGVELVPVDRQERQRVSLVERVRVVGPIHDVNADHIEPSPCVPGTRPAGAAEEIQNSHGFDTPGSIWSAPRCLPLAHPRA
jgi:hypothetical protein